MLDLDSLVGVLVAVKLAWKYASCCVRTAPAASRRRGLRPLAARLSLPIPKATPGTRSFDRGLAFPCPKTVALA